MVGLPKVGLLLYISCMSNSLPSKLILQQKPIHVEKPLENVVFKSLTLKTVHGRKIFHTWEETEKLVAANRCRGRTPRVEQRITSGALAG